MYYIYAEIIVEMNETTGHILNQDQNSIISLINAAIVILGIVGVCLKRINENGFTWNSTCMEINKVEPKHKRRRRSVDIEEGSMNAVPIGPAVAEIRDSDGAGAKTEADPDAVAK